MPSNARSAPGDILWTPPADFAANTVLTQYMDWLERANRHAFKTYDELWAWSTSSLEEFWASLWKFFHVQGHEPYTAVLAEDSMPGARWFPGSTLNYAEHALRHDLDTAAIVAIAEGCEPVELSWTALRGQVGAVAEWLTSQGVRPGDRVVGYLPNIPEAVVAFLACASIGAVWSTCSQEYSPQGAADRFGQLEPVVLLASDGYRYAGKIHHRREQVEQLRELLPRVRAMLWIDYVGSGELPSAARRFSEVASKPSMPRYLAVPFDHPLWVLYSSGTTGRPKGIVHGHGGITLEHLKFLGIHLDVQPRSRFFWFSTTSWMMWNVQVSGLLLGATIVLYDGSPAWPDQASLWRLAAEHRLDFLGTSAAYLLASQKAGLQPGEQFDLRHLAGLGSTGSPLPASCAAWVYESLPAVWLSAASGGTDVASGFCGGVPTLPVRAGEMQARMLGVAMESWDPEERSLIDEVGELVITRPMPSMPLCFWDDPDGTRYRDSYFSTYPGVWRHGDWVTITTDGGVIVHGRSDATMNRFGVRMGSAEIYEAVERIEAVGEALVVGVEHEDGSYWMPLFITTREGVAVPSDLADQIRRIIRTSVSPRHVPDEVIVVKALPHTLTGKRLEVPVKRILQGNSVEQAANPRSVDNPDALAWFADFAKQRAAAQPSA